MNQDNQPTKQEIEGYKELLQLVIQKRIFLEKELVNAYDADKKFALTEEINSLIAKTDQLKHKVNADLQKVSSNTINIGPNSSGNFILQDVNNSNINVAIKNDLTEVDSELKTELDHLKKIVDELKNPPKKSKILFMAANPSDQARLQTDKEYNAVRLRLGASSQRDTYELLLPEFGLTIENLIKAMSQKPTIVHFAGHGEKEGILITNAMNEALKMPEPALRRLFNQHKETTTLVVLNACHSADQAKTISELGFYVIGTNAAFNDEAAINFTTGLYIGLGEGKPVEQAFDDAMIILMTTHPEDAANTEIWKDGKKLDI